MGKQGKRRRRRLRWRNCPLGALQYCPYDGSIFPLCWSHHLFLFHSCWCSSSSCSSPHLSLFHLSPSFHSILPIPSWMPASSQNTRVRPSTSLSPPPPSLLWVLLPFYSSLKYSFWSVLIISGWQHPVCSWWLAAYARYSSRKKWNRPFVAKKLRKTLWVLPAFRQECRSGL